jgi:hypothetical protein
MEDFSLHTRNVLIIMILTMFIFMVLAIIYSLIATELIQSVNAEPPPVYKTGDVINKTGDSLATTVYAATDIANGGLHMFGNLLNKVAETSSTASPAYGKGSGIPFATTKKRENFGSMLDDKINTGGTFTVDIPDGDLSTSDIQQPTSTSGKKTKWCFIGEQNGKRGCVEQDEEYAASCPGTNYSDEKTCLNPTNTDNKKQFLQTKFTKYTKNEKNNVMNN